MWSDGLLVALCLIAMATDSRWRRIPNWLTFSAISMGLLLGALDSGWTGLGQSALGLMLALVITVPLFAMGALKAGDVKLVAAFGAVKGIGTPPIQSFALWAFLYGALVGGLWALATLARARSLGLTGRWLRERVTHWVCGAMYLPPAIGDAEEGSALRQPMPYGFALSLGALIALGCEWLWGCPFPLLAG